jgi:Family of unknown function (DUF6056)
MAMSMATSTSNQRGRIREYLLWLPSITIVGLFAYIGQWVFWVADDFCRGAEVRDLGLIGMQRAEYQNWSGRYTFNALIGLATRFGLSASQLAPPIIAALTVGLFTAMARRLPGSLLPKHFAPLVGAAACLSLFSLYDNFGQSVLWLTGGLTYITPFLLVTGGLLCAFPISQNLRLASGSRIFACALMFLAIGCNEAVGASIIGSLTVALLFGGKQLRRVLLPLTAVSIVGFAVMAAAPGNNVRRSFTHHRKLIELPSSAATDTVRLFVWLLVQRALLVVVVLGVGVILGRTFGKRRGIGRSSIALLIGVPYGTCLLGFVGTGERLAQRARIASLVPMVIGLALLSWFARSHLAQRIVTRNRNPKTRLSWMLPLGIAICATRSVVPAAAAAHNSSAMSQQTKDRLTQGRGTNIPIGIPGPGTIWGLPNFSGDGDWTLRCADRYFNVKGTYVGSNR